MSGWLQAGGLKPGKAMTMADTVLDYQVLARIGGMELLAKTVVEGFLLGLHRSPFRGFSVEFAEYRQYVPGDEIKHIDWKVYAKSDRYYIKQFEEETNLACNIILDCSASMNYPQDEGRCSKFAYAARMAACLSYFMIRQRDAVGLALFDKSIRQLLPPSVRPSHLRQVLGLLQNAQPGGETSISEPLHSLAEGLKRRGMVILISDLLDEPKEVLSALQHFAFLGHEVLVLQVMDDSELKFDFHSLTEFTDLETGEALLVSPEGMRAGYLKEIREFLYAYEKGCASLRMDYRLFNTAASLDLALSEYLYKRSRMRG